MLNDKSVVITGAGSGIGRAAALAAAGQGARLMLADVDIGSAEETVEMIRAKGGEARAVKCDVSSSQEVAAMVEAAVATYGRLDCAFNNAGIAQSATTTVDCPEDTFDRVMAVNAKGVWLCLKHEIAVMLNNPNGGSIVVNASLAGIRANPSTPAYIASKHAAVALGQGAAIEYGRRGVRVNCVCPGLIHTRMMHGFLESIEADEALAEQLAMPGRWGTPEEVAAAVVWLLSDASGLVNGVTLPLDGGKVAA